MAKDTKNNKVKNEKERKTFFKDFKAELKKVTWPTVKQLAVKTVTVIAVVLIIAALVFVLDLGFEKGYEFVITKTSKAIQKDENKNETSNQTTENEIHTESVNTNVELNQENQTGNATGESAE